MVALRSFLRRAVSLPAVCRPGPCGSPLCGGIAAAEAAHHASSAGRLRARASAAVIASPSTAVTTPSSSAADHSAPEPAPPRGLRGGPAKSANWMRFGLGKEGGLGFSMMVFRVWDH